MIPHSEKNGLLRVWQRLVADAINRLLDGDPAGTLKIGVWDTAPTGYALMGTTITDAQTLYPDLWANAPTAWRSGSNLVLPNIDGRTLLAGAPGTLAGSMTHTLALANLPSHSHSMAHTHGSGAGAGQGFVMTGTAGNPDFYLPGDTPPGFYGFTQIASTAGSSAADTGTAGSGTAVTHTPAHMTVRVAIKL